MNPGNKMGCPDPKSLDLIVWGVDTEKLKCSEAECYGR